MALVLTGVLNGIRPVGGVIDKGTHKGEPWNFMSMEISDTRFGKVYSCQLRSQDKQYSQMVDIKEVTNEKGQKEEKHILKPEWDLVGHKVKVTVASITAGEREITNSKGEKEEVIQVRTQVTNLRDLGVVEDDE